MRRTKSGNWNTRVIINGERQSITRPTKRQVEEEVALLKAKARRRRLGLPDPDARLEEITFGALADKFLAEYPFSPRSKRTLEERLVYSRKAFGQALVADITEETLKNWHRAMTVGPTTKHNALRAVKQVLAFGVPRYLHELPTAKLKLPGPAKRRVTPFESWEQVRLVAAHAGEYGPLIRFACATGLRPQEWRALEWRHINVRGRTVYVEQTIRNEQIEQATKTEGSERLVHLQQEALNALAELAQPIQGGLVFPAPEGGVINLSNFRRRVWQPALKAAGVSRRPVDQMRHTFATLALAAGADIAWVSHQLGHSRIQTTLTHYARWLPAADERNLTALDTFAQHRPHSGHIAEEASDA